jgi:hypothetical protein
MVEAAPLGNKAPTAVSAMTRARLLRDAESLGTDSGRVRDVSSRYSICCCCGKFAASLLVVALRALGGILDELGCQQTKVAALGLLPNSGNWLQCSTSSS